MKGKGFVSFLAYIAIGVIAVTLLLSGILNAVGLNSAVINSINLVAQIIAYTITAVYAFYFAKERKHIGWMIAYILFVIVIIVFVILGINF